MGRVREIVAVFLTLGTIAFGGPAAHIAMMREEVVRRRGWIDDRRFLDLVGAVNLIPGPNSTELAIHLGFERARWRGLLVAGACFILPAFLMVLALAWAYVRFGTTPAVEGLLYAIKPVVVAIMVRALVGLLRVAVAGWLTGSVAAVAIVAYLLGVNEVAILFGGGLVVMAAQVARERWTLRGSLLPLLPYGEPYFIDPTGGELTRLFLGFLKIGAVLYGSGYVLLAFLRGEFVERLGWITESQLIDAVAIGHVTPGPLFTTATFVGYQIAGVPGAILATVGIFLPSFAFVALLTRIVDRIRDRTWSAGFLDGVNATALALMAGVTVQLGRAALVDPFTVVLAVAVLLLHWRTRINTAWYIAAAALIGIARALL